MSKKNYIVTIKTNYADEFDVEGFVLQVANSEEEIYQKILRQNDFPTERYFGTNEAIDVESEEEMRDIVTVQEITDEEFEIIRKLLGFSFGLTPLIG